METTQKKAREKETEGICLRDVLARIESANEDEIDEFMKAVLFRYDSIHPKWEAMLFLVPKNDADERRRTLKSIFHFLMNPDQ